MSQKECIECSNKEPKYKCPNCKKAYCSVTCWKQHKEKCKVAFAKEETIAEPQIDQKPLNLNEYEDVILSPDDLSKVKQNEKIMTMLRNKKLKKIIREIDQAKYKKKSLERMQLDPDFSDFCGEILRTMGFVRNHFFTLQK